MNDILIIENTGPEIIKTNYFSTDYNYHGKFFISLNAGAFRLLVPNSLKNTMIKELALAQKIIITRHKKNFNILLEDYSETPFQIFLTSKSFDRLPAQKDAGKTFKFSAWVQEQGNLKKICEIPCEYKSK